jgi:hypothetical protein
VKFAILFLEDSFCNRVSACSLINSIFHAEIERDWKMFSSLDGSNSGGKRKSFFF